MPKRIIAYSKKQPARAIIIAVCGLTVLAGIFMFTPLYGPVEAAPLFGGPVQVIGIYLTAAVNILLSLPGLIGVYLKNQRLISRGAFSMFLWYLFIAMSRAFMFPFPGRLLWLPALMVALIMGVIYLDQKDLLHLPVEVEDRVGDGD